MKKGRLDGRRILVTGGAAGIGFETARLLGAEGAAVALVDVDGAKVEAAAATLRRDGVTAWAGAADVTDAKQIARAVEGAERALGPLDGLFNNAGVAAFGSVHDTTEEAWSRVMAVNVTGTFLVSKAVLPGMVERRRGAVVNAASVAGLVGIPAMAAYCAAKGAVVNLTRQMAADYSKLGVRVNCVSPGTVASTALGQSLVGSDTSPEAMARRLAKYPIGRFGEPAEIGAGVVFLLSDEAAFVTGAVLSIDGGMTSL